MEKVKEDISKILHDIPRLSKTLEQVKAIMNDLLTSEKALSKVDEVSVRITKNILEACTEGTQNLLQLGYEKIDIYKDFKLSVRKGSFRVK